MSGWLMADTTSARYSIHELIELTGISARSVHYYVKLGIIRPPIRSGGRARYTDGDLGRLLLIREYQRTGKKLSVIKAILSHIRDEDLKDQIEFAKKDGDLAPIQSETSEIRRLYAYMKSDFPQDTDVAETKDSRKINASLQSQLPLEASWKRISIVDGVEVNIRDDITRQRRKQMKKLIEYLRYELAENSPT
jgi:DNA-binding transcriptional MerR regulator